jgi:hypothetical protein
MFEVKTTKTGKIVLCVLLGCSLLLLAMAVQKGSIMQAGLPVTWLGMILAAFGVHRWRGRVRFVPAALFVVGLAVVLADLVLKVAGWFR